MVQFASYLRRVLCKTRLIFPRINGPTVRLRGHSRVAIFFGGGGGNDVDSERK